MQFVIPLGIANSVSATVVHPNLRVTNCELQMRRNLQIANWWVVHLALNVFNITSLSEAGDYLQKLVISPFRHTLSEGTSCSIAPVILEITALSILFYFAYSLQIFLMVESKVCN